MSVVARKVISCPVRTGSETWAIIANLIAGNDQSALSEFKAVAGVAASLIFDEPFQKNPLVVVSKGPRLRIYCLCGEDAVTGEDGHEDELSWQPTKSDWMAFLPCPEEELEEIEKILKSRSTHFAVYDLAKGFEDSSERKKSESSPDFEIDVEAFKKI